MPALPSVKFESAFPGVQAQIQQAYRVAQARPAEAAASGRLGMVLDAYQQYAGAAVCYQRAHLLDPSSFDWIYDLAYVEMKRGRFLEAADRFRAALKLNPSYLPARINLAESLLAAGRLAESGSLFGAIAGEHPKSAQAYYGMGRVAAARGDNKAAAASLERACEMFPRYGAAHYLLARALEKAGQPHQAAEQFVLYKANVTTAPPELDPLRAAVQDLNRGPMNYVRRGIALEEHGDLAGAIREHEKALVIDPRDVQAHINLIQLYARAGDDGQAEQEYRTAVKLDPNRDDCYYNYGVLMFRLQRYDEAGEAFRRALEINPYYAEARNNLGAVLERKGRLGEALEQFRQAAADRPDYRLAHFQAGRILVNENQYAAAIREFLEILTPDDAQTPAYLYALGATYARAGDRENALSYLRKARDDAAAHGQTQLLASINQDLDALGRDSRPH
ncbi:MAG: tetratricopeptide repeat protein [Terriglobia bacterium]